VKRVVEFLTHYPCYEEHGAVTDTMAPSRKKLIVRAAMSAIPRKVWTSALTPNFYRRVFDDQVVRMSALKKITEDKRNWDWHADAF
jgi:hypothetical protein